MKGERPSGAWDQEEALRLLEESVITCPLSLRCLPEERKN